MQSARHAANQRRAIWPPEPGFFVLGLVRGAWRVPARIVFEAGLWHAEVDGKALPAHADPVYAPMVDAVWHGGTRVPEADYDWFIGIKAWAAANEPDHPSLHPRRRIDPRVLKPIIRNEGTIA